MSNDKLGITINTTFNYDSTALKEALKRLSQNNTSVKLIGITEAIKKFAIVINELNRENNVNISEVADLAMKRLANLSMMDLAASIKVENNESVEVIDGKLSYEGETYNEEEINTNVEAILYDIADNKNWEQKISEKHPLYVAIIIGLFINIFTGTLLPANNTYETNNITIIESNVETSNYTTTCEHDYGILIKNLYFKAENCHRDIVGVELVSITINKSNGSKTYMTLTNIEDQLSAIEFNAFLEFMKPYFTIEREETDCIIKIKYLANTKFAALNN